VRRKEVAKLAGVSEATVSRVLNGVGPVREETRRRVLAAAERLQYVPNALAQRFARRQSGILGVVLPVVPKVQLFSTYYFSEILGGIGDAAKSHGYDVLLIFREPDEPRDYTLLFRTRRVDACVVLGASDRTDERDALRELQREGYPFSLVNQCFAAESFNTVDADHEEGSRSAVLHLAERGCRGIAFLNGPERYSNSVDRLRGYRLALAECGMPVEEGRLFLGNYGRKSGYEAAAPIAEAVRAGYVDGVFAANDRMAIGLLQGLRERGIEAGRDVALVGYDDSEGARWTEPQLSSVYVPFFEMGRLAAARLLESLKRGGNADAGSGGEDGEQPPFHDRLPVRLVVRDSTARFAK